jgi:hypothetical protein
MVNCKKGMIWIVNGMKWKYIHPYLNNIDQMDGLILSMIKMSPK